MNVLFVTSSALATNPRLLKNYLFQRSCGHTCKILGFKFGNWSDKMSDDLIQKYKIDCTLIPSTREIYMETLIAYVFQKISRIIYKIVPNIRFVAYASDKKAVLLESWLTKENFQADCIEAHNLPALFPAYSFAKSKNIPFCFDVEDFHPGEFIKIDEKNERNRRSLLFTKILPKAQLITAASPLIGKRVEQMLLNSAPEVRTINNSFYSSEFPEPQRKMGSDKIKFVWFSQTVSYGRGLELFIEAAKTFQNQIELHLIGSIDENFANDYIQPNRNYIFTYDPLNQRELHLSLSNYDVGLAIELSSSDANREICLTNKIFAYLQAGLYIFATDTKAQKEFLKSKKEFGLISNQSISAFTEGITFILKNKNTILDDVQIRYSNAKEFGFEKELNCNNNYLNYN